MILSWNTRKQQNSGYGWWSSAWTSQYWFVMGTAMAQNDLQKMMIQRDTKSSEYDQRLWGLEFYYPKCFRNPSLTHPAVLRSLLDAPDSSPETDHSLTSTGPAAAQARVSNRVHLLMVSRVRHSKAELKEGSRQRLPAADFLASTGKH